MRALLIARPDLTALVGKRIYAGVVEQGAALPAIGITEISANPLGTVANAGDFTLMWSRIQVTAIAKTYADQKAVLKACKLGKGTHGGVIGGYTVRAVTHGPIGPDLSDTEIGIYEQSRDFIVTYIEPN